jgi:aminoglycoside phosphotransferase (APT) family kinase protein
MQSSGHLPATMVDWIEQAMAARVIGAARQAGGGRKEAWLVDVADADVPTAPTTRVFLRWDQSDPTSSGDPWTVRREAAVYRALRDTHVPVARFIAMHPTAQAMLLSVVEGDNWFSQIRDAERELVIAQDFVTHLAALHRLDVGALGLDDGSYATVPDLVRAQLGEMETIIEFRGGVPEAALGIALAWLRGNVPNYDGPRVLVQGDTGPGNFMYAEEHVTAIVDWELAHIGDPMDDLAWVSLRAVQEPFTDLDDRFAEYQRLSGHSLDHGRIRFYRVLAEAKIMVMSHGLSIRDRTNGPDGGGDPGGRLVFGQLHRRLLIESLADVMGVRLDSVQLPVVEAGTDRHDLYGVVLEQLRSVVAPRITDSFARQRVKGLARVLKYLEASDRLGDAFAAAELADLDELLGDAPSSVGVARAALAGRVRDGSIDQIATLRVLHRRAVRDNELLRDASGVLSERHYWLLNELK